MNYFHPHTLVYTHVVKVNTWETARNTYMLSTDTGCTADDVVVGRKNSVRRRPHHQLNQTQQEQQHQQQHIPLLECSVT